MNAKVSVTTLAVFLLLICAALTSCALCNSPPVRDTFGDAYRIARDNQVLNPDAALNLDSGEGLDGQAAENIYEKYVDSFKKPQGGGCGGTSFGGFVPLIGGTMK